MTIEEKIAKIKKSLEKRSKESIINDICNELCESNIENIGWMFDIYVED